uniref:Putative secreted protein n=1 Tax=Anopheles darlingi TaxID=43151 RepID=A0A2M4DFT6_ANODA
MVRSRYAIHRHGLGLLVVFAPTRRCLTVNGAHTRTLISSTPSIKPPTLTGSPGRSDKRSTKTIHTTTTATQHPKFNQPRAKQIGASQLPSAAAPNSKPGRR